MSGKKNRHEFLLVLLPWLKAHDGASIEEIAAHFGKPHDEIVASINLLAVSGVGQNYGEMVDLQINGGYVDVIDTLSVDRPFMFDTLEATYLIAGLRALQAAAAPGVGYSRADCASALAKLEQVLSERPALQFAPGGELSDDSVKASIEHALTNGLQLSFAYWSVARDDYRVREVSPLRLRVINHVEFLDGWSHTDAGWRSFRLGRIGDIQVREESAELPDGEFEAMPLVHVTINLDESISHRLEPFPVLSRSLSDGVITAVVGVHEPAWLAKQVMASGGSIRVLEPTDMVAKVEEIRAAARSAYL